MRLLLLALVLSSGIFVKINKASAVQVVIDQTRDLLVADHEDADKKAVLIALHPQSVHSMQDIYDVFGSVLHFPTWFGRNLDALEELLSDSEYTPQKIEIRIYDQATLRQELGEENMKKLLDVLVAASEVNVDSLGMSRISVTFF